MSAGGFLLRRIPGKPRRRRLHRTLLYPLKRAALHSVGKRPRYRRKLI